MNRRLLGPAALALSALFLPWPGTAQADLRDSVRDLAAGLAQSVPPGGFRLGVVEFTPAGKEAEKKGSLLGLALAEVLGTELARGRFAVVERMQLRKVLREGELFGAEDPETRLDLSKAGVRGLVTGAYLPSGSGVLVSARLVRVEDGVVLGAASREVPLDREVRGLLEREFPRAPRGPSQPAPDAPALLEAGVFYEAPNGRAYPVKEGMVLYREDNYRLYFKPNRKAHVYVVQVDARGEVFRLFPNAEGKWGYRTLGNPVEAGTAVWAPEPPKFLYLDENAGREEIYFFAAERPIPELEGASSPTKKSLQRTLKLMGVGGTRVSSTAVEVKNPGGGTLSYETIRAKVNARGDLTYQVWFWHR